MIINMIGSDHVREGKNKQDAAFQMDNLKVVLDGCGSCQYSEVGATLFVDYFKTKMREYKPDESCLVKYVVDLTNAFFNELFGISDNHSFMYRDDFILNNLLFTFAICIELPDRFIVYSIGDGFILAQRNDNTLEIQELGADLEYPPYLAYNYIQDKSRMLAYNDGVKPEWNVYHKHTYKNVGVTTDGIRFMDELHTIDKTEFLSYISDQRVGKLEMFIKKNQNPFRQYNRKGEAKENVFKDDISIVI